MTYTVAQHAKVRVPSQWDSPEAFYRAGRESFDRAVATFGGVAQELASDFYKLKQAPEIKAFKAAIAASRTTKQKG